MERADLGVRTVPQCNVIVPYRGSGRRARRGRTWSVLILAAVLGLILSPVAGFALDAIGRADGQTTPGSNPTIISTSPRAGADTIIREIIIRITFSKPINQTTLVVPETVLVWLPDLNQRVNGSLEYDNQTYSMIYRAGSPGEVFLYPYGEEVQVILSREIRDLDGNPLDGKNLGIPNDYTFSFTIANLTEPLPAYVPRVKFLTYEFVLEGPLANPFGVFLVRMAFWVIVGLVVIFLLSPVTKRFTKRTKTEADDIILDIIKTPVLVLIVVFGVINSMDPLIHSASNPYGYIPQDVQSIMLRIYGLVTIIIIAWIAYRVLRDLLVYYGKIFAKKYRGGEHESALFSVMEKLGTVVIVLAGGLFFLTYLGIDLTVFIAGAGLIGVVVALAMQDSLANFASGIYLTLDKPFVVNELILLPNGDICRVIEIGMRMTQLYDVIHHQQIIIPNKTLANTNITNLSRPDQRLRLAIDVGVALGSDIPRVKQLLERIALEHPDVVKDKNLLPRVQLSGFGKSKLKFRLWIWISDVSKQYSVASEVREQIAAEFIAAGIVLPYSQHTLWWGDAAQAGQPGTGSERPGSMPGPETKKRR